MGTQQLDAWHNGEIIPREEASLSVETQAVLYGINAFEGVRAYWSDELEDLLVFRLERHLWRLERVSMKILQMTLPPELDLRQGALDILRHNDLREPVHFRILVYNEGSGFQDAPEETPCGVFILPRARGSNPKYATGLRCMISPWTRLSDRVQPPRVKTGANYLSLRLPSVDASRKGFDLPIVLNERGKVAEAGGACLFLVREDVVITPPVTASILESITRETLIDVMANDLGFAVREREVDPTELYIADEVFLCGTGAEVLPVVDVDHYRIGTGEPGEITTRVQQTYSDIVHGREPKRKDWLTGVYSGIS